MDAFKQNEISRMQNGGNKAWQDFYNQNSGTSFEESTIKERYDSEVGEEWKERLTAKVDGTEFDKAAWSKERATVLQKQASRSATPVGAAGKKPMAGIGNGPASRSESPAPAPAPGKAGLPPAQKAKNEAYFAKMGEANASRPDDLPPSQGGKFSGFGSAPAEPERPQAGMPSADEFQKDPVAALTKGFGWFSSVVGKQAKVVNDSYIQPTAKTVSSAKLEKIFIARDTDLTYRSHHQSSQRKRAQWLYRQAKLSSRVPKVQLSLSTSLSRARTRKQVARQAEALLHLNDETFGTALALLK
jgi:ADP-ribosylation factor GTPase-activating protein 1